MSPTFRGLLHRLGVKPSRPELPLRGWAKAGIPTPLLDALDDAQLAELNAILPWNCFTVDGHGRRFGAAARKGKRDQPQAVPDPRIVSLDRRFDLKSASVLEIGCFEGVHTAGLCRFSREVTAVDGRLENVVKTILRTAMLGFSPKVFLCDVEDAKQAARLPEVDVVHHVGVLYHLKDPVAHLTAVARLTRRGLMLDTHFALPEEATASFTSGQQTYRCRRYEEFGHADVFSGMYEHSRWLMLDDLVSILGTVGLGNTEIVERRDERNGARVLLYASR
jgi:hypothetical protein